MHYKYFASTDPHERPPNAMLLPFRLEPWGVYEWAQRLEKRSYDSVRPIHSQIMQVAHLRMNLLARYLRRTLVGWRPCYACQAKTDAWKCAVPKRLLPDLKNLRQLTYRQLDGSDCDDLALRVVVKDPEWMQECAEIRQDGVSPEVAKHTRHETWEGLTGDLSLIHI